jgi:hypothetical protein
MASEAILINGDVYDFSATRLDCMGLKRVGFTSIDYGDKLERGEGRGASQVALGVSKGKYSTDPVKITFHRSSGEELRQYLASKSSNGRNLGSVKAPIVLQFIHETLGVQTITFKDCRVNVPGTGSAKEGSDPLTEDWEFYTRLIDRNGIVLYEEQS